MKRFSAPRFWHHPSLIGTVLSPLGMMYGTMSKLMQDYTVPLSAQIPVISVGNVTLGGAGKTPVTVALATMLSAMGESPHILSRGYGGSTLTAPEAVTPDLPASLVGDEPLLLARQFPTWVYPVRAESALRATQAGASLVLLDDGLQHSSLKRDLSFLVIDSDYGLGNGHIIPAGPLRESLAAALAKSDAVIALGDSPLRVKIPASMPQFRARLAQDSIWQTLRGRSVFAFSALANNDKFFHACIKSGMQLADSVSFPDHHPYTRDEVRHVLHRASLLGATPVTTEKDAVKLTQEERAQMIILPIHVAWENYAAMQQFLRDKIQSWRNE
jgi:tetraacyldisaccharide 4'-kinase